ncbi:MAG: ABC transporter permease [Chloroflexi bacterium]|nr:ABC transporter permease [Chloroflexota bacterium]
MRQYVIKRLLLFLPTALLASFIIFTLVRIVPGDVIDALLATNQSFQLSPEQRAAIRAQLGLDRPLPVQFVKWAWGALRFDLGTSFWERRSNLHVIRDRFERTIELAIFALLVAIVWGVFSGVLSAVKQDTWIDNLVRVVTVGGLALPSFFVAVMFYYVLLRLFNWIPPVRYENFLDKPWQNIQQNIAPALVLGFSAGASISRLTRSQFLEVIREDYIRTARAKGLRENVVIIRHALRNSILPVVTVAGLLVGVLLGGTVIVERVFAIPGMGTALITAVNTRDFSLLQALVWIMTLIFMTANLAVDSAYAWIDPRIRYQ